MDTEIPLWISVLSLFTVTAELFLKKDSFEFVLVDMAKKLGKHFRKETYIFRILC